MIHAGDLPILEDQTQPHFFLNLLLGHALENVIRGDAFSLPGDCHHTDRASPCCTTY